MNYAFLLPTLSLGGGERFISEISQYLGKKNKKHFILIIYDNIEYTIGNSAELIILYKNPIITKIPKIRYLYLLFRLWKSVKENKVDLLFCGLDSCSRLSYHLKKFLFPSIKLINICQNNLTNKFSLHKRKEILHYYNYAEKVFACSEGVNNSLINEGYTKKNLFTIPNCVDTEKNKKYLKKVFNNINTYDNQKIKIVTVGSLIRQKNHNLLIEFVYKIIKLGFNCEVNIIGDGQLRKELEKTILNLNLNSIINLVGWKSGSEYFEKLSEHHLFIMTSIYEGLPLAMLEAMSIGLPILSTDCDSGPREVLHNGEFGKLAPINDPNELVNSFISINKDLMKFHILSKQRISKYDRNKIAKDFISLSGIH
ncbi:MAG: hypothetical protein CMG62_00095 [Candidatus Marinimicrobia bacterium]|nr:hypothetical protein [Candidatus Neomarinimicrobiota bacterium]